MVIEIFNHILTLSIISPSGETLIGTISVEEFKSYEIDKQMETMKQIFKKGSKSTTENDFNLIEAGVHRLYAGIKHITNLYEKAKYYSNFIEN